MTHPHNPYVSTREFLDLYRPEDIDMPAIAADPVRAAGSHCQRLWYMFRQDEYDVSDAHMRAARHACYAMVSYVDAQVGRMLDALQAMDLDESTVVVFTADHGVICRRARPLVQVGALRPGRAHSAADFGARAPPPAVRHELASLVDIFRPCSSWPACRCRTTAPVRRRTASRWPRGWACRRDEPTGGLWRDERRRGARALPGGAAGWWKLVVAEGDPPLLFNLRTIRTRAAQPGR